MRQNRLRAPGAAPATRGVLLGVALLLALANAVRWSLRNGYVGRMPVAEEALAHPRAIETAPPTQVAAADAAPEATDGMDATSAQAAVARQVAAFARDRRAKVNVIARKLGIVPPPVVEEFFAAAEAGRWHELDARFSTIMDRFTREGAPDEPQPVLAPVFETYCVADLVRSLPAEGVLKYGQAVLDSVGAADVYISSSDAGQWIPALVNIGRGAGEKIIIAESLLADPAYVEYLGLLHGERMTNLNSQDLRRARQACAMALEHGAPATGADDPAHGIPRQLLRTLIRTNPHLSFALEAPRAPPD